MAGRQEEMHVIVDAEKLAARKLTIEDLRRALQIRNKDTSGGEIWDGKRRYVVRTLGQFTDPRQIEDVIIDTHDGATTYVKDVARVELGYQRPPDCCPQGGRADRVTWRGPEWFFCWSRYHGALLPAWWMPIIGSCRGHFGEYCSWLAWSAVHYC